MKTTDKCETLHCRRKRAKDRKTCGTCSMRKWRENNPVAYAFQTLRDNAKRRGHVFDITREQFSAWCVKTEILAGRGRTATSYHIDRIDDSRGYHIDNIQMFTCSANVAKEHERRKREKELLEMKPTHVKILDYDWQSKTGYYRTRPIYTAPDPDCPF